MIRRLVQAGVISIPAVSAAVRINGGQVMMAQANGELPEGLRDALGDSPEVRGMHETDRAGAGMSEAPKHHVLPDEHRMVRETRLHRRDEHRPILCPFGAGAPSGDSRRWQLAPGSLMAQGMEPDDHGHIARRRDSS